MSSLKTKSITSPVSSAWHVALDPADVTTDINCYIQITLEQKLEDETLQVGDPHIILAIQETLKERAQGMFVDLKQIIVAHRLMRTRFLWAVLQIQHICAQKSDHEILEAIQNHPDLPTTFERILQKLSQTKDVRFASRIFDWLAIVKRPLMLWELREAVAIEPLQNGMTLHILSMI